MAIQAGIDAKALFANMAGAKVRIGANYIREGHGVAVVKGIKLARNRAGSINFHIELAVMRIYPDATIVNPMRVGEDICHTIAQKHVDSFLPNIKKFISVCMSIPADQIGMDEAAMVCDDTNPLAYTIVEFKAKTVKTQKGGNFTQVDYVRTVPAEEARAMLEPAMIPSFFPGNLLDNLIAAEAAAIAATKAA